MILEFLLSFLAIIISWFSGIFKRKRNLPPGPVGLPYFGTFPFTTIEKCIEVKKKYGNIFMINAGVINILYLTDFMTVKDSFSKVEFADRPSWESFSFFEGEKQQGKAAGIVFSNGSHWHHSRRFLLRHLRDLGMGKSKIEGIMLTEVEALIEDFKGLTKEPSKLPFSINVAVLNIIWQLIASHRYEFKDKEVKHFMENIREVQKTFMYLQIPDFYPIVKYVLPKPLLDYIIGAPKFDRACQQFQDLVRPFVDEHLKTLDPNNPRDLMDDYLVEMKEKKNQDYSHFNITDLTRVTFDLFVAGNDTTSNMTRWILIYMARFQEIQEKIQKEIDKVVPRDTLPGLQHRNELAFLDATINEVQRHCSMTSMGVFRYTTTDVKVEGYDIPKDTTVISLAALSHKDPTYFENPEIFDPSRFLDKKGKYIATCDGFQAFGIGKRQCLGEQFARMELYLITAALLQNFIFAPPEGEGQMSIAHDLVSGGQFPRNDQKFSIKFRNQS